MSRGTAARGAAGAGAAARGVACGGAAAGGAAGSTGPWNKIAGSSVSSSMNPWCGCPTTVGVVVSHNRRSSAGAHGTHRGSTDGWHGGNACCQQGAGTCGRGGGGAERGHCGHRMGEEEEPPVRVDGREEVARVGGGCAITEGVARWVERTEE